MIVVRTQVTRDGVMPLATHCDRRRAGYGLKNCVPDEFGNLRDYGVSEGGSSVHPGGNPITSSAKSGCKYIGSSGPLRSPSDIFAPRNSVEPRKRAFPAPFGSFFPSVGNNPHPVASVREANVGSWYAVPDCIIPERGQGSENGIQPSTKQRADVLQDDELRSQLANKTGDFIEQPASFAGQPHTVSCDTNVLAWEPSTDAIDGNSIGSEACGGEFSNVSVAGDFRPVLGEDFAGELFNFAERDCFEAIVFSPFKVCAFKAKRKAAYSAKQVQDPKFLTPRHVRTARRLATKGPATEGLRTGCRAGVHVQALQAPFMFSAKASGWSKRLLPIVLQFVLSLFRVVGRATRGRVTNCQLELSHAKSGKPAGSKIAGLNPMATALWSSAFRAVSSFAPDALGISSSNTTKPASGLSLSTWRGTPSRKCATVAERERSADIRPPAFRREPKAPAFQKLQVALPSVRQCFRAASLACGIDALRAGGRALAFRCECQMRSPC